MKNALSFLIAEAEFLYLDSPVKAFYDLAARFRVMSIPTMILFKGGDVAHTMVGAMRKPELVAELNAHL